MVPKANFFSLRVIWMLFFLISDKVSLNMWFDVWFLNKMRPLSEQSDRNSCVFFDVSLLGTFGLSSCSFSMPHCVYFTFIILVASLAQHRSCPRKLSWLLLHCWAKKLHGGGVLSPVTSVLSSNHSVLKHTLVLMQLWPGFSTRKCHVWWTIHSFTEYLLAHKPASCAALWFSCFAVPHSHSRLIYIHTGILLD